MADGEVLETCSSSSAATDSLANSYFQFFIVTFRHISAYFPLFGAEMWQLLFINSSNLISYFQLLCINKKIELD